MGCLKKCFQDIHNKFPALEIDVFASRLNAQLPSYVAWHPDPGCVAVNAFTVTLYFKMFYAFPLLSLIPRCVQKIIQGKATGILITPFWTTQTWFPQVLQILFDQPWILKQSCNLIIHPSQKKLHPLHKSLRLMVCPVSFQAAGLSTEVTNVPMSSWRPGTKKQYSIYLGKWLEFCRDRKIDKYPPTLNQALSYMKY